MIDRFEHFSYALNELNKYWHKIASEEMKKYGLKSTHSIYLIGCLFSNRSLLRRVPAASVR